MKRMPLVLLLSGCALLRAADWKPLFNEKDFSGWETYLSKPPASADVPGLKRDAKGEYADPIGVNKDPFGAFSWVQVDGAPALKVAGDIPGGIATLASYSNYHLRLEFKWGARKPTQKPDQLRNSGLLYHGHGKQGDGNGRWLPSHQFQVQNGYCGDYIAMGDGAALIEAKKLDEKRYVYHASSAETTFSNQSPDPSKCAKAKNYENPEDQWNTLELYCFDDQVVHVVNGHAVLRAKSRMRTADGKLTPLREGRIELQAEGWEIFFRHLEITPIAGLPTDLSD